jgi:Tfp pilus assembly protein PilN
MAEEFQTEIKETRVIDPQKEALGYTSWFLFGAVIISLFLMLGFYGYLLAQKNSLKALESKISNVDNQIAAQKDTEDELKSFTGAVSNIQSALGQKEKWASVFKELNALTLKEVFYSSFVVDDKGKANISGETDSLSNLAKLMVSLKSGKTFTNVSLTSSSINEGRVKFSLSLQLAPSILKEEKK